MNNNQERELKILLTKEQYDHLLNSYDFTETICQKNTYYDTENQNLKNIQGAVRIREISGKNILTLKLPKDSITKYEFESEIHTNQLKDLNQKEKLIIYDHLSEELKSLPLSDFQPIASFTTIRNICHLDHAELCLDLTRFNHHTDYELEYEYTEEHNGIEEFNKILSPLHLKFEQNCPSKLARSFDS